MHAVIRWRNDWHRGSHPQHKRCMATLQTDTALQYSTVHWHRRAEDGCYQSQQWVQHLQHQWHQCVDCLTHRVIRCLCVQCLICADRPRKRYRFCFAWQDRHRGGCVWCRVLYSPLRHWQKTNNSVSIHPCACTLALWLSLCRQHSNDCYDTQHKWSCQLQSSPPVHLGKKTYARLFVIVITVICFQSHFNISMKNKCI